MWDYLIITAADSQQAEACRRELQLRKRLGMLEDFEQVLAIADPEGRRIGSGGSTIYCLLHVLGLLGAGGDESRRQEALSRRRILILHGGGLATRLPAYGPCGRLFMPVPGEADGAVPLTLLDRQLACYRHLPVVPQGAGQVVVAAGDVLLGFDPSEARFAPKGVSGLGCRSTPSQAQGHGVFVAPGSGSVDRFLQKPTEQELHDCGAVDRYGQTILDLGVVNFDAASACAILRAGGARLDGGQVAFDGPVGKVILEGGLDLYRELCCAMGRLATPESHAQAARQGRTGVSEQALAVIYQAMHPLEFSVQVLGRCEFLHFETTSQLFASGAAVLRADLGTSHLETPLDINNEVLPGGSITGSNAWVESCRISAPLTLGGQNLVAGMDVAGPLSLSAGACVDILSGVDERSNPVDFVRVYGAGDYLHLPLDKGATFCGRYLGQWLEQAGLSPEDVWSESLVPSMRSVWNARLFPAVPRGQAAAKWLWMLDPAGAPSRAKVEYLSTSRYSFAQTSASADAEAFHLRRRALRAAAVRRSLRRVFRLASDFSADDLAEVLRVVPDRPCAVADVLQEAHFHDSSGSPMAIFIFSRVLHTLASAIGILAGDLRQDLLRVTGDFARHLQPEQIDWLESMKLAPASGMAVVDWTGKAKAVAFARQSRAIIFSGREGDRRPVNTLRTDEIVWGRAPARLDLGGGWSDTPPYSLEHGGCVINAAVNLNGQPPIQAYARVIDPPVIRITSIDQGTRLEITRLDQLLDYRQATSDFGLAKAALSLSGLSPEYANWPGDVSLESMLKSFGGGIELTTLSAVPKGSGLGTSSILGAVILAVIQKMMGRTLTAQDLFHAVLRLEQALTTGGGWQDQIGAVVGGVKVVSAEAGLVPQARVHYVPSDVLDPYVNGGLTLLYYTGVTRLAKNILQQVVGGYLDRNRAAMSTLRQIHSLPQQVAAALGGKDLPAFGRWIDTAWRLNKRLDADSSNTELEALLGRLRQHLHGAKLLGAGGGGFLLMIAKSIRDASEVKYMLEALPPNPRARFFDFSICNRGLTVTTC